jgi:hypothetical protein
MTDIRFRQSRFEKRLARLVEECGEVLAAAGKTQRWGPFSVNPLLPEAERETNLARILREMADLKDAIRISTRRSPQNSAPAPTVQCCPTSPVSRARRSDPWQSNPGQAAASPPARRRRPRPGEETMRTPLRSPGFPCLICAAT